MAALDKNSPIGNILQRMETYRMTVPGPLLNRSRGNSDKAACLFEELLHEVSSTNELIQIHSNTPLTEGTAVFTTAVPYVPFFFLFKPRFIKEMVYALHGVHYMGRSRYSAMKKQLLFTGYPRYPVTMWAGGFYEFFPSLKQADTITGSFFIGHYNRLLNKHNGIIEDSTILATMVIKRQTYEKITTASGVPYDSMVHPRYDQFTQIPTYRTGLEVEIILEEGMEFWIAEEFDVPNGKFKEQRKRYRPNLRNMLIDSGIPIIRKPAKEIKEQLIRYPVANVESEQVAKPEYIFNHVVKELFY